MPCGTMLETDPRTRARLELADGTMVALDRATRITYDEPHEISLQSGAIVADVGPGRVRRPHPAGRTGAPTVGLR